MKSALPLITLMAVVSCQTEAKVPANAEADKVIRPADEAKEKDFDPQSLVGMPLEKAQKACDDRGRRHRVSKLDGKPQMGTRDYRPERVNFEVNDGIVTAVTMG
ncbi:MAG: hypothetical protein ABJQ29_11755 [Luteolibacter sp.]